MKNLSVTTSSYLLITTLIITLGVIISILLSFLLGYSLFRAANLQTYGDAEAGLSIFGFGVLTLLILLPTSFLVTYFISMKIATHLREKKGWEIHHPRRLYLVSVFFSFLFFVFLTFFARQS